MHGTVTNPKNTVHDTIAIIRSEQSDLDQTAEMRPNSRYCSYSSNFRGSHSLGRGRVAAAVKRMNASAFRFRGHHACPGHRGNSLCFCFWNLEGRLHCGTMDRPKNERYCRSFPLSLIVDIELPKNVMLYINFQSFSAPYNNISKKGYMKVHILARQIKN
jgi:hypothetical protein